MVINILFSGAFQQCSYNMYRTRIIQEHNWLKFLFFFFIKMIRVLIQTWLAIRFVYRGTLLRMGLDVKWHKALINVSKDKKLYAMWLLGLLNSKAESVGFIWAVYKYTRKLVNCWVSIPGDLMPAFQVGKACWAQQHIVEIGKQAYRQRSCSESLYLCLVPFCKVFYVVSSHYTCCVWYALIGWIISPVMLGRWLSMTQK